MKKKLSHKLRTLYIKTLSWEYWPMWLVYLPASFYYIYLSIKARSFFFFSAANPSIESGGMFFESKWSIFKLIPKEYYPSTILVTRQDSVTAVLGKMQEAGIEFPVIAKPDRGERGWGVKKIDSVGELASYAKDMGVEFLIQDYINYPLEFSVFYYRNPNADKGFVTSVTFKKLLTITGDGCSSMDELIRKNDRSFLQYNSLRKNLKIDFSRILQAGEAQVLVPYGNHARGAMFQDYTHLIDETLVNAFDRIGKQISGFYFGRFDLRCNSVEDLREGKNIAILELNGAGAEPSHIYNPGFSFFKAQKVITKHYRLMYEAALANKRAGIPFMSFKSFRHLRRQEKRYKQSVQL